MELFIAQPEEAILVQKLLNLFDLNAKILGREKGFMIYIKEAEKISDFIKILGANKAVMYFEDVRIYREQKNKTNRLNNCEQANIDRVIATATEQLEQIKIIEDTSSIELLDEKTKETLVVVDNDNLSLAIGKKGQNVRLASRLTHYKLDVQREESNENDKNEE